MNKPVEAILIGAGQRGAEALGSYALLHPEQLRFIAVAEPDAERRSSFAVQHQITPENQFVSWEPLLASSRLGQAALICTQDQIHTAPALAALHAGYDVLLEKPMATSAAECRQLAATAAELGRQLHVCHVLRYTEHFQKMRTIVQSGQLGQVVDVAHRENVAYWHMAHSYVRGNWADSQSSCPMILAKCCHDFDILLWVLGSHCVRLSSAGSLIHFRPENHPPGAPDRCTNGCPVAETCPYNAEFIYGSLIPLWRSVAGTASGFPRAAAQTQLRWPRLVKALAMVLPILRKMTEHRGWPRSVVARSGEPEEILAALRSGPYGRCVYRCNNDAVDHQVVMMEFAGGESVSLTMHGHSSIEYRTTRIEGTLASLYAQFGVGGAWIEVREHRSGRHERYNTFRFSGQGHGGGDYGLMAAFVDSIQTGSRGLTTAQEALESHLLAFAAEQARLDARVVEIG